MRVDDGHVNCDSVAGQLDIRPRFLHLSQPPIHVARNSALSEVHCRAGVPTDKPDHPKTDHRALKAHAAGSPGFGTRTATFQSLLCYYHKALPDR